MKKNIDFDLTEIINGVEIKSTNPLYYHQKISVKNKL